VTVTAELDARALAYGRLVIERLSRSQLASQTDLVRNVAGGGREFKLGVLQQMVSDGVLLRSVHGEAGPKGGPKVHTDYSLAPRSATNHEAFARWST
jgi:hypothetical protein